MQQPEEQQQKRNGRKYDTHWLWAGASAAQVGWGASLHRKGPGPSPVTRAFSIASIYVLAGATAGIAVIRACGIYELEDMMQVGAKIRPILGLPPRLQQRAADE